MSTSTGLLLPFVSSETGEVDKVHVYVKGSEKPAEVSRVLLKVASENRNADFLRIWWCDKYKIPPTDPRLAAYTQHELLIEYLEHAIENDIIMIDPEGNAVEVVELDGEQILRTGNPQFDADERAWARQRPLDELGKEYWDSMLPLIEEEAEREKGKD